METVYRSAGIIGDGRKLELEVPLAAGTKVEVLVLSSGHDDFSDLTSLANSSLDFWDNPMDDEDWNNA